MAHSLAVHSLVDALADSLRERVFTELAPGDSVGESEVARQYEVARPTAKAAIERLVQEGLLHRDAHRSARVPVLTAEEVTDLYFTRSCLESEVARRLASDGVVPQAAERCIRDMAEAKADGPLSGLVEPDIRFHRVLVDALESRRLSRVHGAMMGETRLCMAQVKAHHLLDPNVIIAEHTAILEAIADGDVDRAPMEVASHLDRACHALLGDLSAREKRRA